MGVDLGTYRQRIGSFLMPFKSSKTSGTLTLPLAVRIRFLMTLKLATCLTALLLTCGDIETNPGPSTEPRTSRQTTLSFIEATASPSHRVETPSSQSSPPRSQNLQKTRSQKRTQKTGSSEPDIMAFLQDMRSDFNNANLDTLSNTIDGISSSVNELKMENELLREENIKMKEKLDRLYNKVDKLEGHSRRNNLKFRVISGQINEPWDETEQKIRDFIKTELDRPDLEHVDIERAHRVKSKDSSKCPIIVKFTKYKDREQILFSARQKLRDTIYYVQEDFTERVKFCRRKLIKYLVEARENGKQASIKFDKLFNENEIFRYDEEKDSLYKIGNAGKKARIKHQARASASRPDRILLDDNNLWVELTEQISGTAEVQLIVKAMKTLPFPS